MSRLGRALILASKRTAAPPPLTFASPTIVTASTSGTTTDTSIITGDITISGGQRLVLPFAHTRGSFGTPSGASLRNLVSVVGAGDFSTIDDGDFTTDATVTQVMDGETSGVKIYIMSWVASLGGTGTFQVSWSNSVWSQIVQPFVLESCSVVGGFTAGGASVGSITAVQPTLSGLETNDLAIAIGSQNDQVEFSNATGFTAATNFTGGSTSRHRTSWKNGSLPTDPEWTGFRDPVAKAVAVAVYRRT